MRVQARQFVTTTNDRVLTDDGQQGMRGEQGFGSSYPLPFHERHQIVGQSVRAYLRVLD